MNEWRRVVRRRDPARQKIDRVEGLIVELRTLQEARDREWRRDRGWTPEQQR